MPSDSYQSNQGVRDASESPDKSKPAADSDLDMDRDSNDGGGSGNESELSDVDEAAFEDFDPNSVALADPAERRPAVIDEEITKSLKASKRKRPDGESKKKEAKRDRPKKKKRREEDADASGGEEIEGKRSRKPKRASTSSRNSKTDAQKAEAQKQKDAIAEENMTPAERKQKALDVIMDAAVKNPNKRRKKKDEIDLEEAFDEEIAQIKVRMEKACQDDNEARDQGKPAIHKLAMLPEVIALLNRTTVQHSIVDPDTNFLQSVRFFLEPLNDGSLPAYNIQRDLFAALAKLPIEKDALLASGIGKLIGYYLASKKPELAIKRQAEALKFEWSRPILKRSDDFKTRKIEERAIGRRPDPRDSPGRSSSQTDMPRLKTQSQRELERARMLAPIPYSNRARLEAAPVASYSVAPRNDDAGGQKPKNFGRIGSTADETFTKIVTKRTKR